MAYGRFGLVVTISTVVPGEVVVRISLLLVLLLLIALTIVSYVYVDNLVVQSWSVKVFVLSLSALKAHLLIEFFMGFFGLRSVWRVLMLSYAWFVFVLVALVFLF